MGPIEIGTIIFVALLVGFSIWYNLIRKNHGSSCCKLYTLTDVSSNTDDKKTKVQKTTTSSCSGNCAHCHSQICHMYADTKSQDK